mgnify:CR=1 FL=1
MSETFVNIELMRQHSGIDWPGGFEQHPFVDLSSLPDNQYRLALLILHLHGRTIDKNRKYGMNGVYQGLYPDANPNSLVRDGFLRHSTDQETIASYKVNELNDLAVILGLDINKRSKRQDILDTMLPYASSPSIKDKINASRVFHLTEEGYVIARSLYAEREAVEKAICGLLVDDKVKDAIKAWEAYKSRQYGQPFRCVINFSSKGVTDKEQRIFVACREIYGADPMFYPMEKATPQAANESQIQLVRDTLSSFKAASITKYKNSCTCDAKTCKICAEHDGVVRALDKAVIGKNCPPFHEGCRCHVAPVIVGLKRRGLTRACRNPITNKSEYTSANTYSEWVEMLKPEEREALIKKRKW